MKRNIAILAVIIALSIFAVGCASSAGTESAATAAPAETTAPSATAAATDAAVTDTAGTTGSAADGTLELTLSELAQYNGKDGQPAYVAVDGVIYDLTNLAKWKNGEHNGYSAGQDLTDIIKNKSPHGVAKLTGVPVVGKLIDG